MNLLSVEMTKASGRKGFGGELRSVLGGTLSLRCLLDVQVLMVIGYKRLEFRKRSGLVYRNGS